MRACVCLYVCVRVFQACIGIPVPATLTLSGSTQIWLILPLTKTTTTTASSSTFTVRVRCCFCHFPQQQEEQQQLAGEFSFCILFSLRLSLSPFIGRLRQRLGRFLLLLLFGLCWCHTPNAPCVRADADQRNLFFCSLHRTCKLSTILAFNFVIAYDLRFLLLSPSRRLLGALTDIVTVSAGGRWAERGADALYLNQVLLLSLSLTLSSALRGVQRPN